MWWELACSAASLETKMCAATGESLPSTADCLFERDVNYDKISANAWLCEPDEWPVTRDCELIPPELSSSSKMKTSIFDLSADFLSLDCLPNNFRLCSSDSATQSCFLKCTHIITFASFSTFENNTCDCPSLA